MLSLEVINQIRDMHNKHKSIKAIALELNISEASVKKYMRLTDEQLESMLHKPKIKVTPELIEQINETYSINPNQKQVAEQLGISTATVRRYLNEDNLKKNSQLYEDRDALYFYIYKLFGQFSEEYPVDPWNVLQITQLKKKGYSYKAQLLTLKFFYEVKKNKVKQEHKTIGIIPYIYYDAKQYYLNLGEKQKEIAESIQRQLEKDRIEIHIDPSIQFKARQRKKKRKEIDLNSIVGDEE